MATSQNLFVQSQAGLPGDTLTLPTFTGTLVAGREYEYFGQALLGASPGASSAGTGSLTLSFGTPPPVGPGGAAAVPLPAGSAAALSAAPVLAWWVRRQRQATT